MPTIRDVAREAGVSVATVSYVLNGTRPVGAVLRQRVERAIRALGYEPDLLGRGLRKGETKTVALLIPSISNLFFPDVALGVEKCAREHGYNVVLCNASEDPKSEQLYLSVLAAKRMDGVLVAPTPRASVGLLVRKKIPFVIIDRRLENVAADQIYSDNFGGSYSAVKHLISLGHKKIGLILGVSGVGSYVDRLKGYRTALKENSISFRKSFVELGGSTPEGGYSAARKLLSRHPDLTAIFSTCGMMTLGVLRFLQEKRIRVPQDVSVVDFDDPVWNEIVSPKITAVSQQAYEIGYQGMSLLLQCIEDKRQRRRHVPQVVKLETRLVVRESTAPPRQRGERRGGD